MVAENHRFLDFDPECPQTLEAMHDRQRFESRYSEIDPHEIVGPIRRQKPASKCLTTTQIAANILRR
jgi:hypothetical protein